MIQLCHLHTRQVIIITIKRAASRSGRRFSVSTPSWRPHGMDMKAVPVDREGIGIHSLGVVYTIARTSGVTLRLFLESGRTVQPCLVVKLLTIRRYTKPHLV